MLARLARLFLENDMTLAEINPLAQLKDGSFVALDAHMEMENEGMPRQKGLLEALGIGEEEGTREDHDADAVRGSRSRRSTPTIIAAYPGQGHRASTATSAS